MNKQKKLPTTVNKAQLCRAFGYIFPNKKNPKQERLNYHKLRSLFDQELFELLGIKDETAYKKISLFNRKQTLLLIEEFHLTADDF